MQLVSTPVFSSSALSTSLGWGIGLALVAGLCYLIYQAVRLIWWILTIVIKSLVWVLLFLIMGISSLIRKGRVREAS